MSKKTRYTKYKHPKYLEITKRFLEENYDCDFHNTNKSLCPFHEDNNPSFEISVYKQRIKLRCRAGCTDYDNPKTKVKTVTFDIYDVIRGLDEEKSRNDAFIEVKKYFESNKSNVIDEYAPSYKKNQPCKEGKIADLKPKRTKAEDFSEFEEVFGKKLSCSLEEFLLTLTNDAHENLMYGDSKEIKSARDFMEGEGYWSADNEVVEEILNTFQIGYTDFIYNTVFYRDSPIKVNRIVFPLFDENNIIKGRAFRQPNGKRFKWTFGTGVPVSKMLYGFHSTKKYIAQREAVYLFEGIKDFLNALIFNPLKFNNSVAVFKCCVTDEQVKLLLKCKIKKVIFAYDSDKEGREGMARSIKTFEKQNPNLEFSYYVYPKGTDPGDAYNITSKSLPKQSFDKFFENILTAKCSFGEYFPQGKAHIEYARNSIAYVIDLKKGMLKDLLEEELVESKGTYKAYKIDTKQLKKKLFYPSNSNDEMLLKKVEDIADFIRSQPVKKTKKKDRDKEFYIICSFIDKNLYKHIGAAWIFLLLGQILQKETVIREEGYLNLTQEKWAEKLKTTRQTVSKYEKILADKKYIYKKGIYRKKYRIFCIDPKRKRKSK